MIPKTITHDIIRKASLQMRLAGTDIELFLYEM